MNLRAMKSCWGVPLALAAVLLTLTACATRTSAPLPPTNLSATAGNASLAIAFTVVPGGGGSAITVLEYSLDNGASWSTAAKTTSPLQLGGLTNDQPVVVRLRVTTTDGTSSASNPISGTPTLWPFATAARSANSVLAEGVSTLLDGSAIVVGSFEGTSTFGPTTLTSAGDYDVVVGKTDADGSWTWATRAGGTGSDRAMGVSAFADGSAIITGYFDGTVAFGATSLSSAGSRDAFVAKLDPDGAWAWATRVGGTGADQGMGVGTLADGAAIIVGQFQDTVTFGTTTLTTAGGTDTFVAKLDPDGAWSWASRSGGSGATSPTGVDTLANGSAIITGFFQAAATFGATTVTSGGATGAFVAKTDPDGAWVWATSPESVSTDRASGVSALADGSAIVTGYFQGAATFGGTTLTSAGGSDVFVAKTNPDGSWAWATSAGGDNTDLAHGVSTFSDGSAAVTGSFQATASFGDTTLTSAERNTLFVAKTDPEGRWAWAISAVGTRSQQGRGISTLIDGSTITAGYFTETATFGATTLTSAGATDAFVAKVSMNEAW